MGALAVVQNEYAIVTVYIHTMCKAYKMANDGNICARSHGTQLSAQMITVNLMIGMKIHRNMDKKLLRQYD